MAVVIFSFIAYELGVEKLRKIAKKKEKKIPIQFEPIFYHSPMCESIAGIFQTKNEEILKLATYFKLFRSLLLQQIGNVWHKDLMEILLFSFVIHYTYVGNAVERN